MTARSLLGGIMDSPAPGTSESAPASRLRWLWIAAICAFAVDQTTKYVMFRQLALHESTEIIPNLLLFTHNQLNQGALFGLARDHGELANYAFAFLSVGAILGIAWWSRRRDVRGDRFLLLALGLILGGAAGNLYDRLVFVGVRDFIWVHRRFEWWDYTFNFAVFNVADSCLVVGACLLFLHTLVCVRKEPAEAPASPSAPVAASA
jgi:lipoprotein signal peptidase